MSKYENLVRTKEINYKFIKETGKYWNNSECNSPEVIGPLMEYINDCFRYKEVFNFDEWETYFDNKVSKEQLNKCYLIFREELKKHNIEFTTQQVVDTILVHTKLQTYEGYVREEIAKQFLNTFYSNEIIKVEKTNKEIDNKYFIDYVLTLKNNKKIGVQIKSLSYLTFIVNYDIKIYQNLKEKMKSYDGCNDTIIIYIDEDRVSKLSQHDFKNKLGWWLR